MVSYWCQFLAIFTILRCFCFFSNFVFFYTIWGVSWLKSVLLAHVVLLKKMSKFELFFVKFRLLSKFFLPICFSFMVLVGRFSWSILI